MSYNNTNYNFAFNNFKEPNQIQQKDYHTNLFNRNNKLNYNYQNPNSNKTASNFSYNFLEQKQLNNKEKAQVYNTYYSNFQSQGNQIPYKLNTLNYESGGGDYRRISNNIQNNNISNNNINNILRYNPILNQISQNSIGIINSTSSYPLQYNSINNSISNNMTNATSSYPIQSNSIFPTSLNVNRTNNNFNFNGNKLFNNLNYNSQSNNAFFSNNLDKRNYSSYDNMKDNERRKKEEYSDILRKQIEEKNRRKFLEKQKQLEEDLKYEQKYQDDIRQQQLEYNLKNKNLNSNLSYNIKPINLPKKLYNSNNKKIINTNNINNLNKGEFMNYYNKNNNSIYFNNNNNNIGNNPNINNINNKAININNNNINFFMLDRNQNKRPITSPMTSSIAQNGLGIINNITKINNIPRPIQINKVKKNSIDKINFPFITNKNNNNFHNDINEIKNQNKSYSRANSYNIKKCKEDKKRNEYNNNEYSNIYSILDKINFNGITYRSKYEKVDDNDKEKKGKEEIIRKLENKNNNNKQLKKIPKLDIPKVKNNGKNINSTNNDKMLNIANDIKEKEKEKEK